MILYRRPCVQPNLGFFAALVRAEGVAAPSYTLKEPPTKHSYGDSNIISPTINLENPRIKKTLGGKFKFLFDIFCSC